MDKDNYCLGILTAQCLGTSALFQGYHWLLKFVSLLKYADRPQIPRYEVRSFSPSRKGEKVRTSMLIFWLADDIC